METFAMLTRLSPEALTKPEMVIELNKRVEDRIKQECAGVQWLVNYSVLGPCDYLDIFEAPDNETATKVALIVRSFGHATTETWIVTPWERLAGMAKTIKS